MLARYWCDDIFPSMQDGLQRRDDGRDLDYDNTMMSEGRKR